MRRNSRQETARIFDGVMPSQILAYMLDMEPVGRLEETAELVTPESAVAVLTLLGPDTQHVGLSDLLKQRRDS